MPDGNPIRIGQDNIASNPGAETRLRRADNSTRNDPVFTVRTLVAAGDAIIGESTTGFGVRGTSDQSNGVRGEASSDGLGGVHGENTSSDGDGVRGQNTDGVGVRGISTSAGGVVGRSTSGAGVGASSDSGAGVVGLSSTNNGVYGSSDNIPGVRGISSTGPGVRGTGDRSYGVRGESSRGYGVYGYSNSGIGVFGWTDGAAGPFRPPSAVWGWDDGSGYGVNGRSTSGVGVRGTGPQLAGLFEGNVRVTGSLIKSGGGFSIDHPLDPANGYLNHSFVEAPERKNVYDGVAQLDEDGTASVDLPEWFEALNGDFRYQLTAVGQAAPNLHVAEEVSENRFKIAGGQAGMKVCWQLTGTRKDPWAAANPFEVEQEKPEEEQGRYLEPSLYDAPEEQRVMLGPVAEEAVEEEHRRQLDELRRLDEEQRPEIEELRRRMER